MASCLAPPNEEKKLQQMLSVVRSGQRVDVSGLWGASHAFILAQWLKRLDSFVLFVTPDEQSASSFREDLEFFLERHAPLYPAAYFSVADEREERAILSERLTILSSLSGEQPPICLVSPVSGLAAPVPDKGDLETNSLEFKPSMVLDLEDLKEKLHQGDFRSSPIVTAPGEYSIRGDIVDIYPMASEHPIRIELYDDEIDSLRQIDLESQLSVAKLDQIRMPLPRIRKKAASSALSDFLPRDCACVILQPELVSEKLKILAKEYGAQEPANLLTLPGISVYPASKGSEAMQEFFTLPARGGGKLLEDIKPSLEALFQRNKEIKIICQAEAEAKRLKQVLKEQKVSLKGVELKIGRLSEGFQAPDWGCCYINHHELLQRLPMRKARKRRKIKARTLESFAELKENDLVVHLVHGIAKYCGVTRMEREGGQEDFLTLMFAEDTLLYVPASKIHLLEKYIGGDNASPKLDRLGAKNFAHRKEKVELALHDVAADLLEMQAVRDQEMGVAFAPDDSLQTEFDASFPYQDTEDQVLTMSEIKNDMERTRPMDRLICGDVGFGKTEMAIRAAFKCVVFGKQVAMLAPTTLLVEQHLETFKSRFLNYPVNVEAISRFKRSSEQKKILERTRDGRVDVLIGTHRLLSRDVGFKDLGLLIIDEEQRFGVIHKERLKRLKRTVDVLTMTATPIPRTLHMAMVGLRDISSLQIPPEGRMPIHTRVVYKNREMIRKSIQAEINRGGQVFYLHNRVRTIGRETEILKSLVPKARIRFAHGQMKERELETIMGQFINRKIDVLVCTTIIESGIDLPTVNTMIIDRADTFGLSDLHQLRGRVGRGHVRAHTLLLIPKGILTEVALRRLKAIEELSHLGAGFQVALKDLEIRGAGNILGSEQHGHIASIGYELYCRLLRRTILKLTGKLHEDDLKEVDLDIRVDAYIPSDYVKDDSLRMETLRRLSRAEKPKDIQQIKKELKDRFGRLPQAVKNLLDVCQIRLAMKKMGIKKIVNVQGAPFLLVEIQNGDRFTRYAPFSPKELRFIEPTKGHLYPRKRSHGPKSLLDFLKSRLMHCKEKV